MSREIKFRAFAKEIGTIHDVYELYNDGGVMVVGYDFPLGADDIVLMQYTGLKDKNGVELYEGDILGDQWLGYISYCDYCKQLTFNLDGHGCAQCSGDVHWYEIVSNELDLEVIGSIYENKELLEEQK